MFRSEIRRVLRMLFAATISLFAALTARRHKPLRHRSDELRVCPLSGCHPPLRCRLCFTSFHSVPRCYPSYGAACELLLS